MPTRELVGALVLAAPFLVGWSQAPGDTGETALRFEDREIVESSGLVATRELVLTVNDSGDTGRVFVVDRRTGETVGVTRWTDDPVDVEALAPAGEGHVWVGDIGDNGGSRDSVQVVRVPFGEGERTVSEPPVDLAYRGGARDAEALLAHPRTGRLYVVTKGVFGGEVHEVPADLSTAGPHRMRRIARVAGMVTDGAFFNDGRHLVLRTYGRAVVHAFPSMEEIGSWDLPDQEQGEGVAVDLDGSLLLSSEGQHAEVLRVEVPARIVRRMAEDNSDGAADATVDATADVTLWGLLATLFSR
jgi:hypothetical protein